MISFDQFAFVVNKRRNRHFVLVANNARTQQFTMFVNFAEIIIVSFLSFVQRFANITQSMFKRFFIDVIDVVNNDVASKKRRKRFVKSKDDQRAFFVISNFYNFIFFVVVNLQFRQEIRRFKRLTNRVSNRFSFVFQFLSQKDDDDDDFDLSFTRFYVDFFNHDSKDENENETKIVSSSQQEKKRSQQRQRSHNIRVRSKRSRVRKSKSKNTRDDINLNFDYFNVRKFDFIFDKHLFFDLRIDDNFCFFCNVYRYFEKRDKNINKQYWHCCFNDKISFNMMIFERDLEVIETFFDDSKKNQKFRREREIEQILDKFLYEIISHVQSSNDFMNKARRTKRSKKFHEYIIIYNNVLSFCNEKIKMNEKHNVWTIFRVMKKCIISWISSSLIQRSMNISVKYIKLTFHKRSWNVDWCTMRSSILTFFMFFNDWWKITIRTFKSSRIAINVWRKTIQKFKWCWNNTIRNEWSKIFTTNLHSSKSLKFSICSIYSISTNSLWEICWFKSQTMISFVFFIDISIIWRFDIRSYFRAMSRIEWTTYHCKITKTMFDCMFEDSRRLFAFNSTKRLRSWSWYEVRRRRETFWTWKWRREKRRWQWCIVWKKRIEANDSKETLSIYASNTSIFALFASKYVFYFD